MSFFTCTDNWIFVERRQLFCTRSIGVFFHETKNTNVPNVPPALVQPTHRIPLRGKSRSFVPTGHNWVHLPRRPTHRKHQAATHTFLQPFRNNSPPFKSKSACGCAAQLVYTYVFQKGGKKTLKVLKIRKKYIHKLVATSLGAKTLLRWNTDFTEGGDVLNCFEVCPLFWWLNWNLEVWL